MTAPEPIPGQLDLTGAGMPPADPEPTPLAAVPDVGPDADVTLICEECGEQITGPSGGRNSAGFQMGRHKRSAHKGTPAKPTARRRAGRPTQPTPAELRHPVTSAMADAATEVGGKGAPKPADLARGIGRLVSAASGMAATWAVDSDPLIARAKAGGQAGEEMAAQVVASLTITPDSAELIMRPIARLIAPSGLNAKYGRVLVDNTDIGPALTELIEIGRNWKEFLDGRREAIAELRAMREQQSTAPYVAPTPAAQEAAGSPDGSPLGRGLVAMPQRRTS